MVEGRFASKVVQTALGCTELHKRCVQEQGRFASKVVQTALGCTELHKRCVQKQGRFTSKVVQTALGCTELHKRCVQEQGRFAWKVVQTALGCTELHKRCVQEQSSQSVKLSTNLRLVPRLKSRGTYCHFPIHFHREQLKMSFRAIFVPKFFFLVCGAIYCGR